jgi:hypothetical protein
MIKEPIKRDRDKAAQEPQDFIHSFLFGNANIIREDREVRSHLKMTRSTEGWIGIPHGGIGMGILLELALHLDAAGLAPVNRYPFNVEYRLGGASLRVGDTVEAAVTINEGCLSGQILREGEDEPYMCANIHSPTSIMERKAIIIRHNFRPPSPFAMKISPIDYWHCLTTATVSSVG